MIQTKKFFFGASGVVPELSAPAAALSSSANERCEVVLITTTDKNRTINVSHTHFCPTSRSVRIKCSLS